MNKEIRGVDLALVKRDRSFAAVVRDTAAQIADKGYFTLADFITGISNADLFLLNTLEQIVIQPPEFDQVNALDNLIVLTEMISLAEGAPSTSDNDLRDNLNFFMMVIVCESLKRKGFVEIDYSKLSFGHDTRKEEFVKIKQ